MRALLLTRSACSVDSNFRFAAQKLVINCLLSLTCLEAQHSLQVRSWDFPRNACFFDKQPRINQGMAH